MVLSDRSIRDAIETGEIVISPLDDTCIQPASVDVHLSKELMVFRPWAHPHWIDLRQPLDGITEAVPIEDVFSLQPGNFVLGSTLEHIEISDNLMARLEGKSSLGRIGLLIHATAGYVDPGWKGHLTLELYNVCALPILLYPGMKISQLSFYQLTTRAERPYGSEGLGSKYQNQKGPTPTRYSQEFNQASLVNLPALEKIRHAPKMVSPLRIWLKNSEFVGSVKGFAEALEVKPKTAEDWIYRGVRPSRIYWARLYSVTGLPEFKVRASAGQQKFLSNVDS